MTERALELLCLPDEPCYVLDLGCGSGLSGECIEEQVTFSLSYDISYVGCPQVLKLFKCYSLVPLGSQLGGSGHLLSHAWRCQ